MLCDDPSYCFGEARPTEVGICSLMITSFIC